MLQQSNWQNVNKSCDRLVDIISMSLQTMSEKKELKGGLNKDVIFRCFLFGISVCLSIYKNSGAKLQKYFDCLDY